MSPSDHKSPDQIVKAEGGSTIQNVIQAVINMPAWAWIGSIVIFSICICTAILSAAAIFNVIPLRGLLPTPEAFIPATGEQSLIIVADFDNRSDGKYTGIDPAQYIYEQLLAQTTADNLGLRVERLKQIVDDNTAKHAGKTYNATLVVWGWYDALTITPRITRIKELKGIRSDQEDVRLSLADPTKVESSVITDLPSQTNYLILFVLGIDKFANGELEEAFPYFDNAIRVVSEGTNVSTNPNQAYFYRGYIYGNYKNYAAAIQDYDKTVGLNPGLVDAYNNRGIAHQQRGEFQLALEDYSKAVELDPNYVLSYANRGNLLEIYKADYVSAIADFNQAILLDSGFINAYLGRAYAYTGMADFDSANADFKKVLELSGDSDYVYRAYAFSGLGDYEQAIVQATKAIDLHSDDINAYNSRGSAYIDTGKYALAVDDFKKVIELSPEFPFPGYVGLGTAYINNGDFDLAIDAFQKAIKINPFFPDVYVNLGYAYTGKGDFRTAIDNYEMAISLNPDHSFFGYNNAGFLSLLTLDLEKSISYLERARSITPNPLILLNLGDAYLLSGNFNKALDYQRAADKILETKDIEKQKFIIGVWLYNYLPLHEGDLVTIQNHVRVPDIEGKRLFVHYDLSYSHALLGDFAAADQEFIAAGQLDPPGSYNDYFAYKIRSIENLVEMSQDSRQWFESHRKLLEKN